MNNKEERILIWRNFKQDLKELTPENQLKAVAKWWADAPLINSSINIDFPNEWPTPWELIYEGTFCQCSIAYLMQQTLLMVGWTEDIELMFVDNSHDQLLVLVTGDKVLNYEVGEVFDLDTLLGECSIHYRYKYNTETKQNEWID